MSLRDILNNPFSSGDKEMEEIRGRYITVFGTEDGKIVLADMLVNLGFFDYNQADPVALERMNFARFILKRLGVMGPIKVTAIVGSLLKLSSTNAKR